MYVFLSRDTKTNQIEHAYQTRPKTKLIESYVVGLYGRYNYILFFPVFFNASRSSQSGSKLGIRIYYVYFCMLSKAYIHNTHIWAFDRVLIFNASRYY